MSNKQRNLEAVRIHRPVVTGQVQSEDEAAVVAIVRAIFDIDLLPPCNPSKMWQPSKKANEKENQTSAR